MNELSEFARNALHPESLWEVAVYAIIIFVGGFPFILGLLSEKYRKVMKWGILISASISLVYFFIVIPFKPCLFRFPQKTISILLPRFSGANLGEHFGKKHLNEALKFNLINRLEYLGLDTLVSVKTISYSVSTIEEAGRFKSWYDANIILWGEVVKLEHSARLSTTLDPGILAFVCITPFGAREEVRFNVITTGEYNLGLSDTTFNLSQFCDKIVIDILPSIAGTLLRKDPKTANKLLRQIPALDKRLKGLEHEPFLLLQTAYAFIEAGDTLKAIDLFNISYTKFLQLKQRLDNRQPDKHLTVDKVNRFAAVSKYQEGYLARNLSDKTKAIDCFIIAAHTDTIFWQYYLDNNLLKIIEQDSVRTQIWNFSR